MSVVDVVGHGQGTGPWPVEDGVPDTGVPGTVASCCPGRAHAVDCGDTGVPGVNGVEGT